jgi:hypothetical protein
VNALEWIEQHEVEAPARVEDALIDAHNAGVLELSTETCGYEIIHTRVTRRVDTLNLPAYRHEVTIIARWRDENSTRPLAESFAGYGPTWEAAETKALAGYNAWRMKLNRIGGAS